MAARRPGAAVATTAGLAGFLFVASAGVAQGTDLRTDVTDLASLVSTEQQRFAGVESRTVALRSEVETLTSEVGQRDGATGRLEDAAAELAPVAGFTEVQGDGLVVTLDDASPDARASARAASPDDLIVHQQDVQAVVNALWAAGAEGVMLMDQRLVTTSAVRCVGNTLSLHGRPYSPPYVVTAVGDPEALAAAVDQAPGVQLFRQYVDAFGLGFSVRTAQDLTLPPYTGPSDMQYAAVADDDGPTGSDVARTTTDTPDDGAVAVTPR